MADFDAFPTWKRCLDLALAIPLLVGSLPVLLTTALANRLTGDTGPLMYRSLRVGEHGRPFQAFKLRTMRAGLAGPALTSAGDARITSVGRFLRQTKLDELPQLWNVVRGEMSLVGPRPEDARYVRWSDPRHRRVFMARPGITGLAQVQFRHEEDLLPAADVDRVYSEEILPAKVALDMEYLERRSLAADLRILWRTAVAVVR